MPLPPLFPELSALDLFVSIVRLGSVSRGAAAHGIAQPSASLRIQRLESQLGLVLLERSPTGSVPTTAGSVVASWAEAILRTSEELSVGVQALKSHRSGRLRVVASYTIAEYLLPMWLEAFQRGHPEGSVALNVANSTAVLAQLEASRADIGFIEIPGTPQGVHQQVVGSDELVTVVAPGHPWTHLPNVPIDSLVATQLILREEGSGTRAALESKLKSLGFSLPDAVLEFGSISAIKSAVMTGSSPAVLSGLAVAAEIAAGLLVRVNIDGLVIERRLRAVWPRGRALTPLAKRLLEWLPNIPEGANQTAASNV